MSGDALAAFDNYQGSDPVMVIVNVNPDFTGFGSGESFLYTTSGPSLWVIRTVHVRGRLTGTVGTYQFSLDLDIGGGAGDPWTNSNNDSGPTLGSPQTLNFGDSFSFIWSSEVADNYLGNSQSHGKTAVLGLPLLYLPGLTTIGLEFTGSAGADANLIVRDGFIQIEKLPPGAAQVGGQGPNANVYLLPQI
jgi:hypothetical protein